MRYVIAESTDVVGWKDGSCVELVVAEVVLLWWDVGDFGRIDGRKLRWAEGGSGGGGGGCSGGMEAALGCWWLLWDVVG